MANKTIGVIPYSLALRPANPGDAESEKKIFASLQAHETVNLAQLAAHISEHGSPFSQGTIQGVLTDMVSCTVELLRQGYAVNLDGLSKFYLSCNSKGAASVQEFNPASDIKKVLIRTEVDSEANTAVNVNIDFTYAMTRKEQAAAKKAAKANLPQEEEEGDGGGSDSGDGGSGSGNDDGGDVTE